MQFSRNVVAITLAGMAAGMAACTVGCARPHERPRFDPRDEFASSAPATSMAPLWSARKQHTTGSSGDDLFAAPSPDGERIYFSTSRFSSRYQLVVKALERPALVFLTDGDANDIQPAVSPDGTRLAFASDRSGSWDLYLLPTAGERKVTRIVNSPTTTLSPRWSPDGDRVVCFRKSARDEGWEIWTIDVETGAQTFVTEGLFPDWSPDGHSLVFQRAQRRGEGWYSIWMIRLDGGRPTQLSTWSDGWGAVTPTWSPDGKWIAFTAVDKFQVMPGNEPPAGQDIYLVAANGTKLTNLTGDRPSISEWGPRFARDGTLFFSSDEEGSAHVWSIAPRRVSH